MEVKKNVSSGGAGVTGLLQVAFIVLKLCGIIEWSWLWVLSPTWITAVFVALLLIAGVILAILCE
jgi:hypothetical protein